MMPPHNLCCKIIVPSWEMKDDTGSRESVIHCRMVERMNSYIKAFSRTPQRLNQENSNEKSFIVTKKIHKRAKSRGLTCR